MSTVAANINGKLPLNKQVTRESSHAVTSPVDFACTKSYNHHQANKLMKPFNSRNISNNLLYGSCKRPGMLDQNRNSPGRNHSMMNGNKEKTTENDVPTPRVQLFQRDAINLEWQQVNEIGAGLHNFGSTCFMNSVLQCLTYCPPLSNYLLHDANHEAGCRVSGFCMMCELQRHMMRVLSRPCSVVKPRNIYHRLKSIVKHFRNSKQEDAHEFLRFVIYSLCKSCIANYTGHVRLDAPSRETTVINHIFGGYHQSQVTCLRCKERSNTYDPFMDFNLDIKQNVSSLEKALEKFTQPELLQNENSYHCPRCKMQVSAHKKLTIFRAPNVATFQFKRFDFNKTCGGKITKHVSYPENLNLRPFMSDHKGHPVEYRLNAVLVHLGTTCDSGHYICYVRNSNACWYLMDDSRVSQVTMNQVLNQMAYVLFYVRVKKQENVNIRRLVEQNSTLNHRNVPVMRNTLSGLSSGHAAKDSRLAHPNQSLKSSPVSNISKPRQSKPAVNVPNRTSHCLNKKQLPSLQNREKVSFDILCISSGGNKQNRRSADPSVGNSNGTKVLVPYSVDSAKSCDDDVQKKLDLSISNVNEVCSIPASSSNNLNVPQNPLVQSQKENSSTDDKVVSSGVQLDDFEENNCSSNSVPVNNFKTSSTFLLSVIDINLHSPSVASGSSTNSVGSTADWDITEQDNNSSIKKSKRNYSGWNIRSVDKNNDLFTKETTVDYETPGSDENADKSNHSCDTKTLSAESSSIVHSETDLQSFNKKCVRKLCGSDGLPDIGSLSHSDSIASCVVSPTIMASAVKSHTVVSPNPEERGESVFRDFKSEKSFLVQSGDRKEYREPGVSYPSKRPLSEFLQNDSDSRDPKFSNHHEKGDHPVYKRCKTEKVDNGEGTSLFPDTLSAMATVGSHKKNRTANIHVCSVEKAKSRDSAFSATENKSQNGERCSGKSSSSTSSSSVSLENPRDASVLQMCDDSDVNSSSDIGFRVTRSVEMNSWNGSAANSTARSFRDGSPEGNLGEFDRVLFERANMSQPSPSNQYRPKWNRFRRAQKRKNQSRRYSNDHWTSRKQLEKKHTLSKNTKPWYSENRRWYDPRYRHCQKR